MIHSIWGFCDQCETLALFGRVVLIIHDRKVSGMQSDDGVDRED